jgi:enoyl-CoA hydratase/carnithine racemase
MKTNTTQFSIANHVAWITLDRPEAMNALNPELKWQLSEHLNQIESDNDIWLGIITGAGDRAFCAGMDLKANAHLAGASEEIQQAALKYQSNTTHITERFDFPKPLIAMVNGYALGGGLEIALACDIIIASEQASFGLPEPRRGLIAGSGGVHRLPRQIGLKPAMGYLLTGRHFSAHRAFELGLINEVVPTPKLRETVEGYAADIIQCAPLAVRATKASALKGLNLPLPEAYIRVDPAEEKRRKSLDAKEGPRAFSEKRLPNWQGH